MKDIVRKYAHAYNNIFGHELAYEHIENIEKAASFLRMHSRALFLLKVPLIPYDVKKKGLADFINRFALPNSFLLLIELLLKDKRAGLLADVLEQIKDIYIEEHAVHHFTVTSAVALDEQQKADIKTFLADMVQGTIIYTYGVDKNLIAGIRLQSENLLWERSIDKQLREALLSRDQ